LYSNTVFSFGLRYSTRRKKFLHPVGKSLLPCSGPRQTQLNIFPLRTFLIGHVRKTDHPFFGNRPFFRGLENRASVFRTVFLRKTGKTVIFKDLNDDTPLFFFLVL
jgi:hypothetical protein